MKDPETKLGKILDRVESSRSYFEENASRYSRFRSMVFNTSLDGAAVNALTLTSKPVIEFNILNAYISRLRGEFYRQEPSFTVEQSYDAQGVDLNLLHFLEGHLRAILSDANKDNMNYEVFTDLVSGGYSSVLVYTDYIHNMSMQQKICIERTYDPTLVGYDPNATKSHKGDGRYCYCLHPMPRTKFESIYGVRKKGDINYNGIFGGYNWSYTGEDNEEYVLLCQFFEKRIDMQYIVETVTGETMLKSKYDKQKKLWESSFSGIGVFPEIRGKPRKAEFETVHRYLVTETEVLESMDTDYSMLPLVFYDGDSVMLHRNDTFGAAYQMTRPYVYHCEGIQRLKNFAGSTLANELENIDQNKYRAAIESIPEQYKDAYINYQMPNIALYNSRLPSDPSIQLPPPEPLPRMSPPPELAATFADCDRMAQATLGSYDGAMGINNNQLSGRAIANAAITSNAASAPYIAGYLSGFSRVLEICVDLIPKYYVSERVLPIQSAGGQREHVKVNSQESGALSMQYNPKALSVKVEPGVNFEIQREASFRMLTELSTSFPIFAEFIQTDPRGMKMLLDNLDLRGVDDLKEYAPQFIDERNRRMEEQRQMQKQQAQAQISPLVLKKRELDIKERNEDAAHRVDESKVEVAKTAEDTKRMIALHNIGLGMDRHELDMMRFQSDRADTSISQTRDYLNDQESSEEGD